MGYRKGGKGGKKIVEEKGGVGRKNEFQKCFFGTTSLSLLLPQDKGKVRKKNKTHRVKASTLPTAQQRSSPPPSPARRNAKGSERTPAPMAELQRVKTEEAEVAPESSASESEEEASASRSRSRFSSSSTEIWWAARSGGGGGTESGGIIAGGSCPIAPVAPAVPPPPPKEPLPRDQLPPQPSRSDP